MASSVFRVQRCKPELIAPASPTPHELKRVSDIDDQEGLRFHQTITHFYAGDPSKEGTDPVRVIREALTQALVWYYPLAGRLREGPNRKLFVDCNGEGVLFVEATANAELTKFGDVPPFPCVEELIQAIPGSTDILDCPLFHFQVTRLKCNGFVLALRYIHVVADGFGVHQFLNAVCEMARGATSPSILPVWSREIFNARDEPHVTFPHPEYDRITGPVYPFDNHDDFVERSFFFGSCEMSAIMRYVPKQLSPLTKFEALTAYLWRCRTKVLEFDPEDEVRLHFTLNVRGKLNPPLPIGFYGNAFAVPAVVTTAGKLCESPLQYAMKLVRTTKPTSITEYLLSSADVSVMKGRPYWSMKNSYVVSDISRIGFNELDYGWGKPFFGGPPITEKGFVSFYTKFKNKMGEVGRLVTVGMPAPAMNKFTKELDIMLRPKDHGHLRSILQTCIKYKRARG